MSSKQLMQRVIKPMVFLLGIVPLLILAWRYSTESLSANPLSDITKETGIWTLRFLLATLAVTPLRLLTGWNEVASLRRMLGLTAFFYGTLHLLTYLYLDKFFEWEEIIADVSTRRFIAAGALAYFIMIPLAFTSWNRIVRWMGGKRWRMLHRLVYLSLVAGVVHYFWLVKADTLQPTLYGIIAALLLGFRVYYSIRKHFRKSPL